MVPNGWENKSLESLCDVDAPITYGVLKPGDYVPNGVPLLQIKDLLGDLSHLDTLHRISPELDHEYRRSRIATNDILISLVGTVGRIGLVPSELDGTNIHRNLGRIRTKHYGFLIHYLNSDLAKNRIGLSSSGSSQSALNLSVLRALKVPVPPLPEQRKIAKILSTWDKAISTNQRLIDNSKQQKKALMQQLLTGKKRLLDDSGKAFEGEWEEVKLSQLVKVIGGNAFKSEEFKSEGIPLVKISNIKPDYSICLDSAVFIAENEKFEKFKVMKGHVLIAMSGATTGKVGCYQSEKFAYLNQRVGRFDVKQGRTINQYLFQLLKLPKVQHEILIDAVGGAQPNISNKDIERIKISVPAVKEQQKIASVLSNADQEIELLEQQLADLKQEKKALMQQLLTGKRRVKVDNTEAA